ncbi:MAG: hypothetical protein A2096_03995 [Spirochaetes bacterium GWF1_41_5]|nr:MAG: hypothetical protein A2096_03995 [Spirochaetes bacterium GWF1_41_5]HBE04292.1 DegT/DnrJ/EryC1/StrS aminotransferase [Spirochaetia bacterium]
MSNTSTLLKQEWPGAHWIDNEEIHAVTRVLTAQSPFRYYGPDLQREAEQFEKEFAALCGVPHCLGVSSGTTALQVSLASMGAGPGDEIVVPGYFWVSTVGAVIRSGAVPVLADVDDSLSLDPADLERKITGRTKVVIMVHMGGVIGQAEKVSAICRKRGIKLLEDCAQAAGVSRFGKMAGTFGDMGIFSFQLNKNITAGEGGAIITSDNNLYERACAVHDLGYTRNSSGRLVLDDENKQFWGIGCRMNEMTAAVLRIQIQKMPKILNTMRTLKHEICSIIEGYQGIKNITVADPNGESGAFLKMIFDVPAVSMDFKKSLIANGIKTRANALYPIHMQEWGLHIYYNVKSLVNKKSICGHHSVWELAENSFAADYRYSRGTLPYLDDLTERIVIFCQPSVYTALEKNVILDAFRSSCTDLLQKKVL